MILIALSILGSATAQTNSPVDSIELARNRANEIGFWFPREAAIEYRNIKLKELPALTAYSDSLERNVQLYVENSGLLELKCQKLTQVVANDSLAIASQTQTLEDTQVGLAEVERKLGFWKIGGTVLGIAGFVLGFLIGN